MYFLKINSHFYEYRTVNISAHSFLKPVCVNGYLQTQMEKLLLTAVKSCSDLQLPCITIHL